MARPKAAIPDRETELSRRYLAVIQDWIPVGLRYFADWPVRPNCGHFLGGCHWYGIESASGALAFAAAASSPELDPARAGASRDELGALALKALRYLCFTHDTGPADCVRPATGLGRPENFGTKWGERGLGFFRESQCGNTLGNLAIVARLLGDRVDDETWGMIEAMHLDYADRFAALAPQNGVYVDTQMEENAWTSFGLASVACVLSGSSRAELYRVAAERWMFLTPAVPQDAKDHAPFAGGETVARRTGKTFTTLPDYMAENHGMVHPSYTCSSISFLEHLAELYRLFGQDVPPHALRSRARIYDQLKRMTDGAGYLHPVQGMDWPYHSPDPGSAVHAAAAVLFDDADAAALELRALRALEQRSKSLQGRMYAPEIGDACHDIQDPLIIRECSIAAPAHTYLLHRLLGDGPEVPPESQVERRLRGVRVYPHSGFVFQRHTRGQTSFAWRNCVMVLPLPREGILTVTPASWSVLAQLEVRGRPDSQDEVSLREEHGTDWFAAALVMDRAQGSIRQEVLCAGLPDGFTVVLERLEAREDVVVDRADQGMLRIGNETFVEMKPNCRGERAFHTPGSSEAFKGFVSRDPASDVVRTYKHPAWVNVDGRMGVVFSGSGETVYHNRHYFQTWWAVADDLTLSRIRPGLEVKQGKTVAELAALYVPEASPGKTSELAGAFSVLDASAGCAGALADGFLAAARFSGKAGLATFRLRRTDEVGSVPVYAGSLSVTEEELRYEVPLTPGQAVLRSPVARLEVEGPVDVLASETGEIVVWNTGKKAGSVRRSGGKWAESLRPGAMVKLR
jgi:hypothetical protein